MKSVKFSKGSSNNLNEGSLR